MLELIYHNSGFWLKNFWKLICYFRFWNKTFAAVFCSLVFNLLIETKKLSGQKVKKREETWGIYFFFKNYFLIFWFCIEWTTPTSPVTFEVDVEIPFEHILHRRYKIGELCFWTQRRNNVSNIPYIPYHTESDTDTKLCRLTHMNKIHICRHIKIG